MYDFRKEGGYQVSLDMHRGWWALLVFKPAAFTKPLPRLDSYQPPRTEDDESVIHKMRSTFGMEPQKLTNLHHFKLVTCIREEWKHLNTSADKYLESRRDFSCRIHCRVPTLRKQGSTSICFRLISNHHECASTAHKMGCGPTINDWESITLATILPGRLQTILLKFTTRYNTHRSSIFPTMDRWRKVTHSHQWMISLYVV